MYMRCVIVSYESCIMRVSTDAVSGFSESACRAASGALSGFIMRAAGKVTTQDQQAADYAACKQYGPLYL